jgi:sRNA-binding regulator protein Hfq
VNSPTVAGAPPTTNITSPSPTNRQAMPPPSGQPPRPPRSGESDGQAGRAGGQAPQRSGDSRGGARPAKAAPPPPGPISEGQVEELLRLAQRLEILQEQLEERMGKALLALTKPEAKEWIKRLRAMADEIAPAQKIRFGQWPEGREDREAGYLREQREASSPFTFKLFNGEEFTGTISDFTPYTITIKIGNDGEEVVLRKLAIAYYRRLPVPQPLEQAGGTSTGARRKGGRVKKASHDHTTDDAHQPVDPGIDSDRAGQPEVPEVDSMDEDRGI